MHYSLFRYQLFNFQLIRLWNNLLQVLWDFKQCTSAGNKGPFTKTHICISASVFTSLLRVKDFRRQTRLINEATDRSMTTYYARALSSVPDGLSSFMLTVTAKVWIPVGMTLHQDNTRQITLIRNRMRYLCNCVFHPTFNEHIIKGEQRFTFHGMAKSKD